MSVHNEDTIVFLGFGGASLGIAAAKIAMLAGAVATVSFGFPAIAVGAVLGAAAGAGLGFAIQRCFSEPSQVPVAREVSPLLQQSQVARG